MDGNLFYSSAVEGEMEHLLGAPHYSYRFAEANFRRMFARFGAALSKLVMPEYYGSPAAFPPGAIDTSFPSVQLIFRSTEQIRLLKFARNVCCFAWEFDVLKADTRLHEHPFLNQKRMLDLCDEIWVPSEYTRSVLHDHGIDAVHCIPAPIPLPEPDRPSRAEALALLGALPVVRLQYNFLLSAAENRRRCETGLSSLQDWLDQHQNARVYVTILNPEDFRKNLDALLRGFYHFSEHHPDAVLIVKALTSSSRFHLLDVVSDVIPAKFAPGTVIASDRIAIVNEYLSDAEMGALYGLADCYLGTSVAEGQNLPLLEAMAHGTLAVTTANTAMRDYIDPEYAVVIRDHRIPNDSEHLAGCIAGRPFHIHRCTASDVVDALRVAHALPVDQRTAMAQRGRAVVAARYSDQAVWDRVSARLSALLAETVA